MVEDKTASLEGTVAMEDSLHQSHLSRRWLLGGICVTPLLRPIEVRAAELGHLAQVKALTFDVYGTCTDFWSTITRKGEEINTRKDIRIDWDKFLHEWRVVYEGVFAEIRKGNRPWQGIDATRRAALGVLVNRQGFKELNDSDLDEISRCWERLDTWPDTLVGLGRLKKRYLLAPLSNADMSAMISLSKNIGLPWDAIFTAELVQVLKPDPRVYEVASRYMGLRPEEILMVACHKFDLRGAKTAGFKTVFVERPMELGVNGRPDTDPSAEFDLNVRSFSELADDLNA